MKNIFTILLLLGTVLTYAQELPTPVVSFNFENGYVEEDNGASFGVIDTDTNVYIDQHFGNVLEIGRSTGISLDGDIINDTNFTISTWFYDSTNWGQKWWHRVVCIYGTHGSGTKSYGIGKTKDNNSSLFGDVTSAWGTRFEGGGVDWDFFEWNHLVIAYNKPTFTFYVNGDSLGSIDTDLPLVTVDSIFFGVHAENNLSINIDNSINGYYDAITVYDTCLSKAQARKQYTNSIHIQLGVDKSNYLIGDSIGVKILPEFVSVNELEYTSLNPASVSVNGLKLTAEQADTVKIIGKLSEDTQVLDTFEVMIWTPATSVTVTSDIEGDSVEIMDIIQLTADFEPAASPASAEWSVDDPSIAYINPITGILYPKATGTVMVTATANDGTGVNNNLAIKIYRQTLKSEVPIIEFNFNKGLIEEVNGKNFTPIGSVYGVNEDEYFGNVFSKIEQNNGLRINSDYLNDTAFTVSMWINDTKTGDWKRFFTINADDGAQNRSYTIGRSTGNGGRIFADMMSSWGAGFRSSGVDFEPKEWNHIAVVYQKPNFCFYFNGDSVGNQDTDKPIVGLNYLFFGLDVNHNQGIDGNESMNGYFDEVQVYDTVLSKQKIKDLFINSLQGIKVSTDLAEYRIGDSIGVTVLPDFISVTNLNYTSLDEAIVSVDGAKLTAESGDTVKIIGKWEENLAVLDTFEVIVLADTIVILSADSKTVGINDSLQMHVDIAPATPGVIYDWSVKNMTGVASIDTDGILKPTMAGKVEVVVKKQNSTVKDSMIITILNYGTNMLFADYSFDADGSDAIGNSDMVFFNNAQIVNDSERGPVVKISEVDTGFMAAQYPLLYEQDSFTFAAWYYYDQVNIDSNYQWSTIFEFNQFANKNIHYYLSPRLWSDQYGLVSNAGPVGGSWKNISVKPHFPTNTWYHIAVTQANDMVTVYLNGNEYTKGSTGVKPSDFAVDTFFIGSNRMREGTPMNAMFDDLKFYHKALNASEIEQLAGTIKVMEIYISGDAVELSQTLTMKVDSILPANINNDSITSWEVIDGTGSATIDSKGVITPLSVGTVTVKATSVFGRWVEKEVTIYKQAVPVTNIAVTALVDSVKVGSTLQMLANVTPDNADDTTLVWSVNNSSIATINATTGELTGVGVGTVTVTATANDGSGVMDTKDIKVYTTVGLYDMMAETKLEINPNPATDAVMFNFGTEISGNLIITDVTGRIQMQKQLKHQDKFFVDVSSFNNGLYFVTIHQKASKICRKLIVK